MYMWLKDIIASGWLKLLSSFKEDDCCAKCNTRFTHIWFDKIGQNAYAMCIICRNEWVYKHCKIIRT